MRWFRAQSKKSATTRSPLRREPARPARDASVYFVPLALAGLLWLASIALLDLGRGTPRTTLVVGQRAPATVLAQVDFEATDLAGTRLSQYQLRDAVLPVFAVNEAALASALRSINQLCDRLLSQRARAGEAGEAVPDERPAPVGLALPISEVLEAIPTGTEEPLRTALTSTLTRVWQRGIISVSERQSQFHGVAAGGRVAIRVDDIDLQAAVEVADLQTTTEAVQLVVETVLEESALRGVDHRALQTLVRGWIQPNLMYDVTATEADRARAEARVQPVRKQMRVGDTLMVQGDVITAQHLEDSTAHQQRLDELQSTRDRRLQWAARSLLLLFALIICAVLLQIVRPDVARSPSLIALLVILALLTLLSVKGLITIAHTTSWMSGTLVEAMLPLAFAPLLTTILVGPATAVVIGVWTSFAVGVMLGNSFSVFAIGLLSTIIVAHIARQVRHRSHMIRIGLWIGAAHMLYGLSQAMLNQLPLNVVAAQAGMAMVTGVVTALLALMILPMFESFFDITTDITLLELSDMGHPLLQRLAMEAPGSYHHSLMVANLAQAAATEVGANALLVRVCAYFHDIGKLAKPEFFVENSQFRENPHDDLSPSMSTLVIISHVKEGVSMARRARLPSPIIDAIEQHHGTGLILYFYHRARTLAEDSDQGGTPVNEADFRYPGPKPRTPEMGILLLADSVEAASRSMEKPNPNRIESLVNEIVDARLQDGQLDECDLTFAQLTVIKRAMIFTLTNMLHGRVAYPKDEHRDQQPAAALSSAGAAAHPAGPLDDGPRASA
jgi:cyclic-di-AMP phosphodiesterase PgpH